MRLRFSGAFSGRQLHIVRAVILACPGNNQRAANKLGVHRNTIGKWKKRLGLDPKSLKIARAKIGRISIAEPKKTPDEMFYRRIVEHLQIEENNRLRLLRFKERQSIREEPNDEKRRPEEFVTSLIRNALRPRKLSVKYRIGQNGYGHYNNIMRRKSIRVCVP